MAGDINPNSRTPFVDSTGKLSKYGMDTINKLYRILEVSGDTSVIADLPTRGLTFISGDNEDYVYEQVSTNFETFTYSFLNVDTASVVITLNPTPDDGEQVIVHKNTGSESDYIEVTDGTGTDRLVRDQTTLSYRYSIDLDQWVRGG